MVLTKSELIASLQNEVRILLHLATKIEPSMRDYRPTPKQRSTVELLKYMSVMGPLVIRNAVAGGFDPTAWTAAQNAATARDFDDTVAAIAAQSQEYESILTHVPDADFSREIEMFGRRSTLGYFIINLVLCSCAAYRTQIFLYLKACGRSELNTMNLWAGMDSPMPG